MRSTRAGPCIRWTRIIVARSLRVTASTMAPAKSVSSVRSARRSAAIATGARVSAEGRLYTCLFAGEGTELRPDGWAMDDAFVSRLASHWQARAAIATANWRGEHFIAQRRVEMFLVGG